MLLRFDSFIISSRRRHTSCALVTGVQTCALPISLAAGWGDVQGVALADVLLARIALLAGADPGARSPNLAAVEGHNPALAAASKRLEAEIGRASCRERVGQ